VARACYRILDLDLTLESPSASFLEAFHQDYQRFARPGGGAGRTLHLRFDPGREGGGASLEIDGRRVSLQGHPDPERCAVQMSAQALMECVEAFTVLHAAVLGTPGGALALSGPSGAGKTTLTLALLESGCAYLSDDFCPIHRETGLVHPFPRSLWVRDQAGTQARNLHRGKVIHPLDGSGFAIQEQPCALRWLVCLDAGEAATLECLSLVPRSGQGGPLLEHLRRIEGLELERAESPGLPVEWRIRYPKGEGRGGRVRSLIEEHRRELWNAFSTASVQPDFTRSARLEPISGHEAAFFLLRELKQTRVSGSGSEGRLSPGALLAHLSTLLEKVACFRLTPGSRDARLALIQGIMGQEEPA